MNLKDFARTLPDLRREKVREIARETCSSERSVERWIYGYSVPPRLKREAIAKVTGLPESSLWSVSDCGNGVVASGRLLEFLRGIPTPMQQLRSKLTEATGVSDLRVRMWMNGQSVPSAIVRKRVCEVTGLSEIDIWPSLLEKKGGAA